MGIKQNRKHPKFIVQCFLFVILEYLDFIIKCEDEDRNMMTIG